MMRPTIPLADWRIAVDLTASRALRDVIPPPPCEWTCPWCRNWAVAYSSALPANILRELHRLGVDPTRPTDVYAYSAPQEPDQRAPSRVTFHTVGRILSGPPASVEDARLGTVRPYFTLDHDAEPPMPGLSVAYEKDVAGTPSWADALPESLVQIDFRLPVAWKLAEPHPSESPEPPARGSRGRPQAIG
jgi:pyruvate-formate lyase-activating enzyme